VSDRASAAEAVARSRARQGLPRHVEDPAALARIAALLIGTDHQELTDAS
jgi:hypothetical protein